MAEADLTRTQLWVVSLAILLVAAFLRLASLGYESLWLDEFFTLSVSGAPLSDLPLAAAETDKQPPLFYLLLKAITTLGTNEVTARLTSALAGLATIPAIGWIAARLSGRRAAVIAMGILAVSPFHLWYSQEARAYALVLFFLTLSAGFLLRTGSATNPSRQAWLGFVATTVVALYTHVMAMPFLLVQLAVALWFGRERGGGAPAPGESGTRPDVDWKRVFIGQGIALLVFLPQFLFLLKHTVLHEVLPPTSIFLQGPTPIYSMSPGGIAELCVATAFGLFTLLAGFSLGPSVRELHEISRTTLYGYFTPGVVTFFVLVAGVAWLAFRATRRRSPLSETGFVWTAVVLLAIPVAVFFAERPFRPRYVAIALPGLVLWLAGGIANLRAPTRRNAAVLALLAALLIPLSQRRAPRYVRDDVRSAAAYLLETGTVETNLVVSTRSMAVGLLFYLEEATATQSITVQPYPASADSILMTHKQAAHELRGLLSDTGPTWLLLGRTWENDPHHVTLPAARETHELENQGVWPGVELFLLRPKTAHR